MTKRDFLIPGLALGGLLLAMSGGDENDDDDDDNGGPTPDPDLLTMDYEDASSVDDLYIVNDVRGSHYPQITSERSKDGSRSLLSSFTGEAKTANMEYRFPANGHGYLDEVRTSFDIYPTGFDVEPNGTVRFFWAPLTNGTHSSGVDGKPNGTNGWSNAIGFANRGPTEAPAPDGYNFFSYPYHMDQPGESGDFQITDTVVWMDEWNHIEAYVKCNSFQNGNANADGVMRYTVNGEVAWERTDMRFTTQQDNMIEGVGPMGYKIGSSNGDFYYDNHVIDLDP